MTEQAGALLLEKGLLGLIVFVAGVVILYLAREVKSEHQARIADAKATTAQLLQVTEKVNETVSKLHDLGEIFDRHRHP